MLLFLQRNVVFYSAYRGEVDFFFAILKGRVGFFLTCSGSFFFAVFGNQNGDSLLYLSGNVDFFLFCQCGSVFHFLPGERNQNDRVYHLFIDYYLS